MIHVKKHILLVCKNYKDSDSVADVFAGKEKTMISRTISPDVCRVAVHLDQEILVLVDLEMLTKETAKALITEIPNLPDTISIVATTSNPDWIPPKLRGMFSVFKQ